MQRILAWAFLLAAAAALSACRSTAVEDAPGPSPLAVARAADTTLIGRHERFLEARGQLRHASAIESLLVATRYPHRTLSYRDSFEVRAVALEMAMQGVTPGRIEQLEEAGIDLFRLDWQQQRIGQAATTELVVVAVPLRTYNAHEPGDGFRSSVELVIRRVLKGVAPADTIVVRRRSGLTAQGDTVTVPGEFDPVIGRPYLLFLSNALYDYRTRHPEAGAATSRREIPEEARAHYFVERYPSRLRVDWLARPARRRLYENIQRVAQAFSLLEARSD